jgi:hypothetical protein
MANRTKMRDATSALEGAPKFFRAPLRAPSRHGGPGPWLMGVGTLTGDKVRDAHGDALGTIEEIMLDPSSGKVAYAVLSFGGFLGFGDKLFAIPWRALTLDTGHKCFVLDVDRERLKLAPGFNKHHWPAMADRSWACAIHEFYETKPYWAR